MILVDIFLRAASFGRASLVFQQYVTDDDDHHHIDGYFDYQVMMFLMITMVDVSSLP